MNEEKKQSLLNKYSIPIDHLDFKYIEACKYAKEIEKIVEILKSGEEGFYPDLTTCAENKLKELCPNSKLLRIEGPIKRQENMDKSEIECINNLMKDFTVNMKQAQVPSACNDVNDSILGYQLPEIRKSIDVMEDKTNPVFADKSIRIGSCDYRKWDKYDADTEVLKIDLAEEKNREKTQQQQTKLNKVKIEIIDPDVFDNLSSIEREALAEKHRLVGNDFFRSNSFVEAVAEYSKSVKAHANTAAFNNRAIAYIKMNKFADAIDDCDECLKIEPQNIKAMLRKAEALSKCNKVQSVYEMYVEVLKLQPDNQIARKEIEQLRKRFPELAPKNAFRLNICEKPDNSQAKVVINERKPNADDLSSLIIPKNIVKSKLSQITSSWDTISRVAKEDVKKLHEQFTSKREPNILPELHNEKLNQAVIEEIFD